MRGEGLQLVNVPKFASGATTNSARGNARRSSLQCCSSTAAYWSGLFAHTLSRPHTAIVPRW